MAARISEFQNAVDAQGRQRSEPDDHDGAEQRTNLSGAAALNQKQADQNHEGNRHDQPFSGRRRNGDTLDSREDRNGGCDDRVAAKTMTQPGCQARKPPM